MIQLDPNSALYDLAKRSGAEVVMGFYTTAQLKAFVEAAVSAEREACAGIAEAQFIPGHTVAGPAFAARTAALLRARGTNPEACPNASQMGEHACTNRAQCWEPCGELGKSAVHAVPLGRAYSERIAELEKDPVRKARLDRARARLKPAALREDMKNILFGAAVTAGVIFIVYGLLEIGFMVGQMRILADYTCTLRPEQPAAPEVKP